MKKTVYNLKLDINWKLLGTISQIDRFDASWSTIEKKEGLSLKQLKFLATIQSVGASTRIEGSKMSDEEVGELLNNIDTSKLKDRDSQEVVGYVNVLELISDAFAEIEVSESSIKNLHNLLLKYSSKDEWHKGNYKQHTNAVEATFPDGTKQVIFKTTEAGFATDDAMRALVKWYNEESEVHPLIKTAAFVYDFLSIHPFQDGNGRLSRLLTILLLLKSGYNWIQYISLEHEIENHKKDYYRTLRSCQAQRPNEDIKDWVDFFLDSLINVQQKLAIKLEATSLESGLSPKHKSVYTFISNNPGCKSSIIANALHISKPTVKRIIANLILKGLVEKFGHGAGTNYSVK